MAKRPNCTCPPVSRYSSTIIHRGNCELKRAGGDQLASFLACGLRAQRAVDGLTEPTTSEIAATNLVADDPGRSGGGCIVLRGLPMPPSVNALFANAPRKAKGDGLGVLAKLPAGARISAGELRGAMRDSGKGAGRFGRIKTDAYRAWITHAGTLVNLQRAAPIKGRFGVRLLCDEREGKCDPDNLWKASLDLLKRHQLITDDSRAYVRHLELDWREDGAAGLDIIVTPWPPKP